MNETILTKTGKTLLLDLLKKLHIINENFTGKLTLNFNMGGLTALEKTEKFECGQKVKETSGVAQQGSA